MLIAPTEDHGAVRQTWRMALCLAAVAVAALTAFHAAPEPMGAGRLGFPLALGVAGYAVTRLVRDNPEGGPAWNRLVGLWAGLARWGAPALVTVIVTVLAVGLFLMPPAMLRDHGWTALLTAVQAGGQALIAQGPYDPRTGNDLLMHGWLPGVMAQLAVGWSVVVIGMQRLGLGRWTLIVAAAGLLASLCLDLMMRRAGYDVQAFYLAPPQAWPFLTGACAALIPIKTGSPSAGRVGSVLDALARCGTVALPFYLWSWPVLAMPGLILARPLTVPETIAALGAAFILALATHRWVETPVRRRLAGRPFASLAAAAAAFALAGGLGAACFALGGLPARASPELRAEEAGRLRRSPLIAACHTEGEAVPPAEACTVPARVGADVVLWGNSHADHLSPAVLAWAETRGLGVRQATRSGCLPLLSERAGLASAGCVRFNRAAVAEWGRTRPRGVMVGAGWTVVIEKATGNNDVELTVLFEELTRTVRTLRAALGPDAVIVLLGTTPDYAFIPGLCHARRDFVGLSTKRCDAAVPDNAVLAGKVDAALAAIAAAEPGVILYRPWDALCEGGLCRTRGPDGPWYVDRSHLTAAGGARQTAVLAKVLNRGLPDSP